MFPLYSLGNAIDSIKQEIRVQTKSGKPDDLLASYIQLGELYFDVKNNYTKALESYQIALEIARQENKPEIEAQILYRLGHVNHILGEYPTALGFLKQIEQLPDIQDKVLYPEVLDRIGNVYVDIGEYGKSSEYLLKALGIREINRDSLGIMNSLYSLGSNEFYQKDFEKSLYYYHKALDIARLNKEERWRFTCLAAIGGSLREQERYDEALEYLKESLLLAQEIDYQHGIGYAYLNMGITYHKSGQYVPALENLLKAEVLGRTLENTALEMNSLTAIGEVYQKQGNIAAAKGYLTKALGIAEGINSKRTKLEILENVAEIYKELGSINAAYSTLKEYIELNDALYNEERLKQKRELESQYMVQMQEFEIETFKREQERIRQIYVTTGITIGILVLILLWSLYSRYQIQIQHNEKLKSQNQVIQDENEKLYGSNTALEQFAYIVSHDLREPMRMIGAYASLLERRYKRVLDDRGREFIGFITDGVTRMNRLLKDLLDYSRLTTPNPIYEPTDLNHIVSNVIRTLGYTIEEKQATVHTTSFPTLAVIPSQIEQVFQNLIANAIKFHGERLPEVSILVEEKSDKYIFSIKDNGIGIPKEHQERIFQIFQRLHTREKYDGTGIGLAVCQKIIENHRGEIWVESQAGEGSTFSFSISKTLSNA